MYAAAFGLCSSGGLASAGLADVSADAITAIRSTRFIVPSLLFDLTPMVLAVFGIPHTFGGRATHLSLAHAAYVPNVAPSRSATRTRRPGRSCPPPGRLGAPRTAESPDAPKVVPIGLARSSQGG